MKWMTPEDGETPLGAEVPDYVDTDPGEVLLEVPRTRGVTRPAMRTPKRERAGRRPER